MELTLKRDIDEWRQDFLFEEHARSSFSIRHFPPTIYDWQFAPSFTSTSLIKEAIGRDIKGNLFNAPLIKIIRQFFELIGIKLNVSHQIIDSAGVEVEIDGNAYNVIISMPQDIYNQTVRDKLFELLEEKNVTKVKLENTSAELKIAPIEIYKNDEWTKAKIISVKSELFESNFASESNLISRMGISITAIDESGTVTEIRNALTKTDYLWRYDNLNEKSF